MQLSNWKFISVVHVKKAAINDTPGFKVTPVDRTSGSPVVKGRWRDQVVELIGVLSERVPAANHSNSPLY